MTSTTSPIKTEHLVVLGGITLEFARLEQFMSHYVWALIAKDSRVGQAITAPMTLRNRISLFRSLFHMLPARGIAADVVGFDRLISRAEKAVERRNHIVHALIWHPDSSGDLAFTRLKGNPKGAAHWIATSASVAELTAVASDIYSVVVDLSKFMQAHFGGNILPPPGGRGTLWRASPRKPLPNRHQMDQRS
jgi:hypothetical protein